MTPARRAALNELRTHGALLRSGRITRSEWFDRVSLVILTHFENATNLRPAQPGR